MKILIVLRKLKGGVGGSNTEIAKILRKRSHKVDILSREDDLKIFSLVKSIIPLRKKIKKLMKKENYDIIFTQDYSCAIPLLFPSPLFWKKHFCCFCGIKRNGLHKILQCLIGIIMSKKIIVVSDELKDKFKKSSLIYRGVNFKEFKPLGKKRDFIGGLDRTYETISKEELNKISEKTGLKLKIAKDIPKTKMNNFYNNCKVFVSLPRTGGFNNVWAEAMAAGVPIVIGNMKGPGRKFPFNKVSKEEKRIEGKRQKSEIIERNYVGEIIKIIKNPKKVKYREWLIKNGFSWEEKAKEVENFLEGYIEKEIIR